MEFPIIILNKSFMKFKNYILLLNIILLTSCNQQTTHMYLLQHPKELKAEVEHCESLSQSSEYCLMVKRTYEDFYGLVNLRQSNPLQFGQQIISAEQHLVVLEETLKRAKKDFPSGSKDVKDAEKAYDEQQQKVNVLLAVVGAMVFE